MYVGEWFLASDLSSKRSRNVSVPRRALEGLQHAFFRTNPSAN